MKRLPNLLAKMFSSVTRAFSPVFMAIRMGWKGGPLRAAAQAGRFLAFVFWAVVHWCAGLNLRLLLQGLPALVVGFSCLAILLFAALTPTQEIELRYAERARSARKGKEYPEALACFERLANLQNDRPDVLYEWALTAQAADQPERCAVLMNHLASPDKQGYPKAHLWHAVRLVSAPNATQQMRQLAESHLLLAIEGGIEDQGAAHGLLGELYFNKGLFDQAEQHLLVAVKTKTQARMRLALVYAYQGKLESAKTEAQQVANLYRTAAKADLFNHNARIAWADATAFLEDFPQAVAILEEGLTGTGREFYRLALARTYASWFDYLGSQKRGLSGNRLALLEIGLRYDPKNLPLLDRLLSVTGIKHARPMTPTLAAATVGLAGTTGPMDVVDLWIGNAIVEAESARTTLQRLLAAGEVSSQVHFALGADAWDRGKIETARFHWERAHQLSPDMPTIANNLAWLLYQTSPGELNKALDLMNLAIEKAPRETNFRDTRGHILAKLGRFKEAIADLETALPYSPNSPELHKTLAEAYEHLDPAVAAEHRRFAAEKSAKKIALQK